MEDFAEFDSTYFIDDQNEYLIEIKKEDQEEEKLYTIYKVETSYKSSFLKKIFGIDFDYLEPEDQIDAIMELKETINAFPMFQNIRGFRLYLN